MTPYTLPFETLCLLSTAISMGLFATFVPPLGNRMLRLTGAYWLGTLLAFVLYGVLFSLSLLVSPAFATPADMVWSSIFIMLPLNVRSWHHAVDRNWVNWSLLALVLFSLALEFVVPMGSVHFPARVALVGMFQLMGIAWLSWEMRRFDPRRSFSQLGLIQMLTLMQGACVVLRLGHTLWLAPRPLVQNRSGPSAFLKGIYYNKDLSERALRYKIREFENDGLIEFEAHSSDKRSKKILPTAALLNTLDEHAQEFSRMLSNQFLIFPKK